MVQAAGTGGEARALLAGPGIYLVYVTSRRPGATGLFTLLLEERGVRTPATPTPLVLERPLHGELSEDDALLSEVAFRTIETGVNVIRVAAVEAAGSGRYTLMLDRDLDAVRGRGSYSLTAGSATDITMPVRSSPPAARRALRA